MTVDENFSASPVLAMTPPMRPAQAQVARRQVPDSSLCQRLEEAPVRSPLTETIAV